MSGILGKKGEHCNIEIQQPQIIKAQKTYQEEEIIGTHKRNPAEEFLQLES